MPSKWTSKELSIRGYVLHVCHVAWTCAWAEGGVIGSGWSSRSKPLESKWGVAAQKTKREQHFKSYPNTRITALDAARHTGHTSPADPATCAERILHASHTARCPHGTKAIALARSKQTATHDDSGGGNAA